MMNPFAVSTSQPTNTQNYLVSMGIDTASFAAAYHL